MPRPCEKDHPLSPAVCRLCWHWENTPAYRARWGGGRLRNVKPRLSFDQMAAKRH